MGRDKALLEYRGSTFVQRIAQTLVNIFKEVILISDHGDHYPSLGLRVYEDKIKHCGPLGGIHSALLHAASSATFVISCDLPEVSAELVEELLETANDDAIIVPSSEGRIQPLCGYYHRSCLPPIQRSLRRGQFRVLQFLDQEGARVIQMDEWARSLRNINTPEEYQSLLAGISSPK